MKLLDFNLFLCKLDSESAIKLFARRRQSSFQTNTHVIYELNLMKNNAKNAKLNKKMEYCTKLMLEITILLYIISYNLFYFLFALLLVKYSLQFTCIFEINYVYIIAYSYSLWCSPRMTICLKT